MSALVLEGISLLTLSMTTALLLGKQEGYCSMMNENFSASCTLHPPCSELESIEREREGESERERERGKQKMNYDFHTLLQYIVP